MGEETKTGTTTTDIAINGEGQTAPTTISNLSDPDVGGRKDWGNKLVVNTGLNPVVNFNFMLRVEGLFDLPCKAVKGIRRENEFDYIQEGGLNDYVHLKRKAISKPFTFQVERYVGVNWIDPMPLGTELLLPVILFVNTHVFPGLQPVRTYAFTGCTVIGKDYGELNAEASGLLLETVTIAYREMVCLDIPSDTYKSDEVWHFDGKNKQGAGKRHYNSNLYNKEWESNYSSLEGMQERAEKGRYKHSEVAGKNVSAKHDKEELTRTGMEKKASRWKPEPDENGGLKTLHGRDYEQYVADYNKTIDEAIKKAQTPEETAEANAKKKLAASPSAKREYVHTQTASREGSATYQSELSRAEMEKLAAKWKPEKDAAGGLKTMYGRDFEEYAADYNKLIDKEIAAAKTQEEKTSANAKKLAMAGSAKREYVHTQTASREGSATYQSELSRAEMEKLAAKWKPEKDAAGGLKSVYGRDYEEYVSNYNKAIDEEIKKAQTPEEAADANAKKKIAMSPSAKREYVHTKTASREGSAPYLPELTRTEMEERAARWEPERAAGGGLQPKYGKDYEMLANKKAEPPEARLWPPVRSAKQITEYLKKH